jgi:hypothetical protein
MLAPNRIYGRHSVVYNWVDEIVKFPAWLAGPILSLALLCAPNTTITNRWPILRQVVVKKVAVSFGILVMALMRELA